jgi:hypothetical protein
MAGPVDVEDLVYGMSCSLAMEVIKIYMLIILSGHDFY